MTIGSALQTTLAAEHAAVWVYGVLGGQTSQSSEPTLFAQVLEAYAVHRGRRDRLTGWVRGLGSEPIAAAPAYAVPDRLGTAGAVRSAALEIERGCATTYASMVAETSGSRRRWAVDALSDAAVRELVFRGIPEMFPGAAELTDR